MLVRVGKIDAKKFFCDACQRPQEEAVRECVLPSSKTNQHPQYFDLCVACRAALEAHPDPYVTLDKPIGLLVRQGGPGVAQPALSSRGARR